MEWYLKVVRDNYANFNGRARRQEYWMFTLINFIIGIILSVIALIIDTTIISNIYSLAVFVPSIAVAVRRLHDTGKSGWNLLWILTGIGIFYLLYLYIKEGDTGSNEYGSDPKGSADEDQFGNQTSTNNPFSGENNPFNSNNENNPFRNNS